MVVIFCSAMVARVVGSCSFVSFTAMMESLTTPDLHPGMGDSHRTPYPELHGWKAPDRATTEAMKIRRVLRREELSSQGGGPLDPPARKHAAE